MWAPELSRVRDDIQSQLPEATFHKEVELSVGPVGLGLVRFVTSLIPDAREARPYLKDVSRVQVGVYEATVTSTAGLSMPKKLRALLDDGWEVAIRMRDEDEAVWLLYRADDESIREVFVVVLNPDELVLVKAKGRLERLVALALEETHDRPRLQREPRGM
jgi:hypothetical protein